MEIGKEIIRLRNEKGYNIRKLSELCGYNISTLSIIEQGKRNAGIETVERILNALGYKLTITQINEDGE